MQSPVPAAVMVRGTYTGSRSARNADVLSEWAAPAFGARLSATLSTRVSLSAAA